MLDVVDDHDGPRPRRGDAPEVTERCLKALREIRQSLSEEMSGRGELFDFSFDRSFELEKTTEAKLDRLSRACVWQAIAVKVEFKLKLLYTIDGYLSAVTARNPVSTFLLARYLLELVATVSEIDFLLEECNNLALDNWGDRGTKFFAVLFRSRYSTSDEKFKSVLKKWQIPPESIQPIKIRTALKRLANRDGFSSVVSMYDSLSNVCHHNGSGHRMLVDDVRLTKSVTNRRGDTLLLKEDMPVASFHYPATHFALDSVGMTARRAWQSAHYANEIVSNLREAPFTDKELRKLTQGKLTAIRPADFSSGRRIKRSWHGSETTKIGRNDPCPCGSGKKFKVCCFKKGPFRTSRNAQVA